MNIRRTPRQIVDTRPGFLALPAWRRIALTLPALALLWLGVWWASLEAAPL